MPDQVTVGVTKAAEAICSQFGIPATNLDYRERIQRIAQTIEEKTGLRILWATLQSALSFLQDDGNCRLDVFQEQRNQLAQTVNRVSTLWDTGRLYKT